MEERDRGGCKMRRIQHFKRIFEIVGEERMEPAFRDAIETERYSHDGLGASLGMLSTPENVSIDFGFAEATIDPKTGEYTRFARRGANEDTTIVSERRPDGSWEKHSYTPVRRQDGSWETKVDLPTVYQLKFQ